MAAMEQEGQKIVGLGCTLQLTHTAHKLGPMLNAYITMTPQFLGTTSTQNQRIHAVVIYPQAKTGAGKLLIGANAMVSSPSYPRFNAMLMAMTPRIHLVTSASKIANLRMTRRANYSMPKNDSSQSWMRACGKQSAGSISRVSPCRRFPPTNRGEVVMTDPIDSTVSTPRARRRSRWIGALLCLALAAGLVFAIWPRLGRVQWHTFVSAPFPQTQVALSIDYPDGWQPRDNPIPTTINRGYQHYRDPNINPYRHGFAGCAPIFLRQNVSEPEQSPSW